MDEELEDVNEDIVEDEEVDRGDDFVPDEDENDDDTGSGDNSVDDDEEEDGDTEAEGDEGTEDEDEGDDEDGGDGDTEPAPVPYNRFSEVIGQRDYEREQHEATRKQNEELLTLLKQQQASGKKDDVAPKFDYDAAEDAHMDAVLAGDAALARKIATEIRQATKAEMLLEASSYKKEALESAAAEAGRLDDETKFVKVIDKSTAEYAFLDPKNKRAYNQEAVNEINDVWEGLVATGKTKAQALQRAINIVAPKYGEAEQATLGKKATGARRKAAVKKNVSASNKQPPKMRGKTTRSKTVDQIDINKMSDKAFKKLSKAELAELRGDKV